MSNTTAAFPAAIQDVPEDKVSAYFREAFSPSFTLYPEVMMRMHNSDRIRIDFIGIDKTGKWDGPIGFELKRGSLLADDFSDFSNALAQSIDYSRSVIESDLDQKRWYGRNPRYVFMFHCPYRIYETQNNQVAMTQRDWWAQGEIKLAGKYGTGAAHFSETKKDWGLFLGGHPAYWLSSGPTFLGMKHAVGEKSGSDR